MSVVLLFISLTFTFNIGNYPVEPLSSARVFPGWRIWVDHGWEIFVKKWRIAMWTNQQYRACPWRPPPVLRLDSGSPRSLPRCLQGKEGKVQDRQPGQDSPWPHIPHMSQEQQFIITSSCFFGAGILRSLTRPSPAKASCTFIASMQRRGRARRRRSRNIVVCNEIKDWSLTVVSCLETVVRSWLLWGEQVVGRWTLGQVTPSTSDYNLSHGKTGTGLHIQLVGKFVGRVLFWSNQVNM